MRILSNPSDLSARMAPDGQYYDYKLWRAVLQIIPYFGRFVH